MKTVTGKITDSTPVSISKAASILSKFVSSENGASQALNAYLRRATAAFDELSRLHSKSDRRKHKKDSSLIRSVEASQSELVNNSEQMLKKEVKEEGSVGDEEIESKKEKKRKRKGDLAEQTEKSNGIKKEKAEVEENGSVVDKIEIREEEENKKKKRKRKSGEVEVKEERDEEEKDGLEEEGQRKKRRRKQLGLVLRVFLGRFGLTLTAVAPNLHLAGQLSEPANVMSLPAWAVHDCSNDIGLAIWGEIRV
ncbi:hypothetical protein NC653_041708 [Populus alba x Populus x berolinensis]|uniref:Uncharacterized protein n=1 Tax=Populus alba x Populus x berolinensis TaxID=444605 RepID=A0AAD6LA55_9ROSI|nr:hypothetical protein NC653_041708 [Populus alba x Populus x berolinensis]